MKQFKRQFATLTLLCLLVTPVFGGDMHIGGLDPTDPPPPPCAATNTCPEGGTTASTDGSTDSPDTTDAEDSSLLDDLIAGLSDLLF